MTLSTLEAWAMAHPYLWSAVVLTTVPALTSAVAEAVRRTGKADTLLGQVVLALCADVLAALRAKTPTIGVVPPKVES